MKYDVREKICLHIKGCLRAIKNCFETFLFAMESIICNLSSAFAIVQTTLLTTWDFVETFKLK